MSPATSSDESNSTPTKYTTFTAKDSDSDSDIADIQEPLEPLCIDKRDSNITSNITTASKLSAVPDFKGVRFCRVCREFLPIGKFPRGQRRFTCRPHLWQRIGKKAKETLLAKPRKRLLALIQSQCYKDSRFFGLPLALTQADVDMMLDTLELTRSDICIDEVAVLPKDLSSSISKTNTVLVAKHARRMLLDKLRPHWKMLSETQLDRKSIEEQQHKIRSSWHTEIESASLIPSGDEIFDNLSQIEVLPDSPDS
jgi:hypothetical protein